MCLSMLGNFAPCKTGYQVKGRFGGTFEGTYYGSLYFNPPSIQVLGAKVISGSEGYTESTERCKAARTSRRNPEYMKEKYEPGFHVFHRKKDALDYMQVWINNGGDKTTVVKVRTNEVVCTGYQMVKKVKSSHYAKVTVCREIILVEEV